MRDALLVFFFFLMIAIFRNGVPSFDHFDDSLNALPPIIGSISIFFAGLITAIFFIIALNSSPLEKTVGHYIQPSVWRAIKIIINLIIAITVLYWMWEWTPYCRECFYRGR